jgi:glycine betaine/choline ABC-type transport system substrate-binding protein
MDTTPRWIMKRKSFVVFLCFIWLNLLSNPVHCCVGRLLIVAVTDSPDQVIMGEMLSVLINQRTGTTVEIVTVGDVESCHETVLNGKANIYINYIGMGRANTAGSGKADDPQKVYTLVSQSYKEKFGMIWLKPFGFEGPLTGEAGGKEGCATLAAPVTTKDVLKKFPVLDRLINKLGGRIDSNTLNELREKTEKQDVEKVVKEFLKAQRLI